MKYKNETLKTIHERRSIRFFRDEAIPSIDIHNILEAANKAPSAHNQQSWKFFVLRNQKKEELAKLVNQKSSQFPRPSSILLRMASRSISGAPIVIAVSNTGELIKHGTDLFKVKDDLSYDFFRTMEIQSSAAAVENMLLAAKSLGLGAVWLGVLFLIKKEVLKFFGKPQGEFMAVIPVGYPLKASEEPRKKPLELSVEFFD